MELRPFNKLASAFLSSAIAGDPGYDGLEFISHSSGNKELAVPDNVRVVADGECADAVLIFETDPTVLSDIMLEYLNIGHARIIAPRTERYFLDNPLYLISVPKSGTHLLYELAGLFGYTEGVQPPYVPKPGWWYCIEYTNSHTSARDFFIDTLRRSPFGARKHPFPRTPAIFIYRNPLDILVSEANYYHKDGRTLFQGYLSELSFEERLLRLVDDPWLLGSIRDRVGSFAAWLDFPNVIPISFEELIGSKGGGDSETQVRLIWSLMLKLHIPGDPEEFGRRVFNPDSDTFNKGQIGMYKQKLTDEASSRLKTLPQDFMKIFGYDSDALIPARAEEFRQRPLKFVQQEYKDKAVLVCKYLDTYIFDFKGRLYGVPEHTGMPPIEKMDDATLAGLYSDTEMESLENKIVRRHGIGFGIRIRMLAYRLWKLMGGG